jgi:5'-deoxynucleotidase YfbR-like HD superfamily hydrolase
MTAIKNLSKYGDALEVAYRMSEVTRWHIIQTHRRQTLAEHSCTVAMLARELSRKHKIGNCQRVCVAALYHDAEETLLGDVPSSVKRSHEGLARHVGELEDEVGAMLGLAAVRGSLLPEESHLIKVCDLADAVRFVRENASGALTDWVVDPLVSAVGDRLRILRKSGVKETALRADLVRYCGSL